MYSSALKRLGIFLLSGSLVTFFSGCSGGGSGGAASGSAVTSIVGQVQTGGGGGHYARARFGVRKVNSFGVGCTVTAYDLLTGAVIGSTTSDSNGNFTLGATGLTAGTQYKVVTTCSGGVGFTSVMGAVAPAAVASAQANPPVVDAAATVVAIEVMQAIVAAVNTVISSIAVDPGHTIAQAIINTMLTPAAIQAMTTQLTVVVEAAVANGSMVLPADTDCGTASTGLASSSNTNFTDLTNISNVGTTVQGAETTSTSNGGTIPAAVTGAVTGAANSAAAFPACDPNNTALSDGNGGFIASQANCTLAVAKMMYNMLGFGVALAYNTNNSTNAAGAGLSTSGDCSSSNAVLNATFPQAIFTDALDPAGTNNICYIQSGVGRLNRNQSGSNGGGGNGGTFFIEAPTDGGSDNVGILTTMATQLLAGAQYYLSDLDKMVFTPHAQNTQGFDARLIYVKNATNFVDSNWASDAMNGGGNLPFLNSQYSFVNGSSWTPFYYMNPSNPSDNTHWGPWMNDASSAFAGDPSQWDFGGGSTWTVPGVTDLNTLSGLIDGGSDVGVFMAKFGNASQPIPPFQSIIANLVNGRMHIDQNPTGSRTYQVLYGEQPDQSDISCQWSNSLNLTNAPCLGVSGDAIANPAIDVMFTTTGSPVSHVSSITGNLTLGAGGMAAVGASAANQTYYLAAQSFGNGGPMVFSFVNNNSGQFALDEQLNTRYVLPIYSSAQCAAFTDPNNLVSSCAAGKFVPVTVTWPNCHGGNCTPTIQAVGNAFTATNLDPRTVASRYTNQPNGYVYSCSGPGNCTYANYVVANTNNGSGQCDNSGNCTAHFVTVAPDGTTGAITAGTISAVSYQQNDPNSSNTAPSPTGGAGNYFLMPIQVGNNSQPDPNFVNLGNGTLINSGLLSPTNQNLNCTVNANTGLPCLNAQPKTQMYVAVDGAGNVFGLSSAPSGPSSGALSVSAGTSSIQWVNSSNVAGSTIQNICGGACANTPPAVVAVFTDAYLDSVGANFTFPNPSGGSDLTGQYWSSQGSSFNAYTGPFNNPTFDCRLDPYFADAGQGLTWNAGGTTPVGSPVTCTVPTFNWSGDAFNYVNGQQCWGGTNCSNHSGNGVTTTGPNGPHLSATIALNQNNGFLYKDPMASQNLLQLAFNGWFDGTHYLKQGVSLNALQGFALIYLFLTEGDGGGNHPIQIDNVSGLPAGQGNGFLIMSPILGSDNNDGPINAAISSALTSYAQPN